MLTRIVHETSEQSEKGISPSRTFSAVPTKYFACITQLHRSSRFLYTVHVLYEV